MTHRHDSVVQGCNHRCLENHTVLSHASPLDVCLRHHCLSLQLAWNFTSMLGTSFLLLAPLVMVLGSFRGPSHTTL